MAHEEHDKGASRSGSAPLSEGLGAGALTLNSLDGYEVSPGVTLIGQPTPVAGTDKMRCLANVGGALGLVELRLRFTAPNVELSGHQRPARKDEDGTD